MKEKQKIYYTRTYRHLKVDKLKSLLYFLCLILPVLLLFMFNLEKIIEFMTTTGTQILSSVFPDMEINIVKEKLAIFGMIQYIDLPTIKPEFSFIFWNLIVTFILIIILSTGKRKGKPISIYLLLSILIHCVNCIYFLFAADYFPYQVVDYSGLYIKQQIGIWLTFIVLSGLVTGFLGGRAYIYKALVFIAILAYSFIFGIIRYILFLFLLEKFSVLYMALMFFVFGPLFDFMYMVAIYSILVNKMVRVYENGEGRGDWTWA